MNLVLNVFIKTLNILLKGLDGN